MFIVKNNLHHCGASVNILITPLQAVLSIITDHKEKKQKIIYLL